MVTDSIPVFKKCSGCCCGELNWQGLRMEVALVRGNAGLAQCGGMGDKEK